MFAPTVVDENSKTYTIMHALAYSEKSHPALEWTLTAMRDLLPSLSTTLRTIFTDRGAPTAIVNLVFPNAKHLFCDYCIICQEHCRGAGD